jgi:Putative prokaryotic signal transducing protein
MDDIKFNWYRVYSTDKNYEAAIVKGKLEENDIPVLILNKQDSSYIFLGEIELHVPMQFKDEAIKILDEISFD